MKERNLGIVGLSPHDSSDLSIDAFRAAFSDVYKPVEVGKEIIIAEDR